MDQELFIVITVEPEPRHFGPFTSRREAFVWAQTTDQMEPLDFADIRPLGDPDWSTAGDRDASPCGNMLRALG